MDKFRPGSRGEPIPSILKKPKSQSNSDLIDKRSKIKRENVTTRSDVNLPLAQGCTPLMYACQQADYKTVVEILNRDVSSSIFYINYSFFAEISRLTEHSRLKKNVQCRGCTSNQHVT